MSLLKMMKEQEDTDLEKEIEKIVNSRILECRNSILASQIQKTFPHVNSHNRRNALRLALSKLPEESIPTEFEGTKKELILQLLTKTIDEDKLEEYIMNNSALHKDSFLRKLPISIQDKRLYRKSFLESIWSLSLVVKCQNYMANKYENFMNWFDFWNDTLKVIEGQHGAAVLAYFLFLRWLLYMNMMILLLNILFIVVPQLLFVQSDTDVRANYKGFKITGDNLDEITEVIEGNFTQVYSQRYDELKPYVMHHEIEHVNHTGENITANSPMSEITQHCKELYQQSIRTNTTTGFLAAFQDFLQGTGPLERTLLFTGFYPPFNITPTGHVYDVAFAFICVFLASFIISCVMMIKYSSVGIHEAFMSENTQSYYYSNEMFSCWDYCIKDIKTASLHHEKFVLELKTNVYEDLSKRKVSTRSFRMRLKLNTIRLIVNAFIMMWLLCSLYLIYIATLYQMQVLRDEQVSKSGLRMLFVQYLPTATVVILNSISPTIFDRLGHLEQYTSQTSANLSLIRNVFLYLSSDIILLNTVQSHVICQSKDLCGVGLDETCHSPRCWETYVGQQLYKLTLIDVAIYIAVFFCYDLVQYFITYNFDNALTRSWGHPIFYVPTEVLDPIYSQTSLWLGVFYAPLLPLLVVFKLIIIFYIKKVKILVLCDPAQKSYRASKFNSLYTVILFVIFLILIMVHSFAIEYIPPSRGCGPFRYFKCMAESVPQTLRKSLFFLLSHWFIVIVACILCFVIQYYWRNLQAQKRLLKILRSHLIIQSADKQFLLKSISNLSSENPNTKVDRSKMRR